MMPILVKTIPLKILAVISLLLLASAPSWGADFDKGLTAAQNGDYVTALNELRPLAEQGHAEAQNILGWMYCFGRGVPKDYKAAFKWYSLAAEQGHAEEQFNHAHMYYKSKGWPRDYKLAIKWYRLAAKQGHAGAQNGLGWVYRKGPRVLRNNVTAYAWYYIAASNGHGHAVANCTKMVRYMTAEQIAAAKALADKCIQSNYKSFPP